MRERIQKLRLKNLNQEPEICSERAVLLTQAYEENRELPAVLLRAKAFEKLMHEMTIWIAEDELIVGNQAKMAKGSPIYPEYSVDWILKELDSFDQRKAGKYKITPEMAHRIFHILQINAFTIYLSLFIKKNCTL